MGKLFFDRGHNREVFAQEMIVRTLEGRCARLAG
jgi:hypothetical protein